MKVEAGDAPKAVETYEAWLKKHPEDGSTRFLLASLLLTTKQFDRAAGEHETLLKEQPDNAVLLNNLAWLYDLKNDPRALELAQKAFEKAPDAPTIADTLGWILVRKGESPKALPVLEKAAAAMPGSNEIQYHYAVALKDSGNADGAKGVLEKIIASKQASPEVVEAQKLLDTLKK
jgi:Flp pilus assembly protein TadD